MSTNFSISISPQQNLVCDLRETNHMSTTDRLQLAPVYPQKVEAT